jgi:putative OPT family oligopeptide transporter
MNGRKLPSTAYELKEGETFVPLTKGETLAEFTIKAVIAGAILGIIFGAANTYLGLKAGLTISTSIPVAVLTVVVFRVLTSLGIGHTILESNMSQTIGSASSSVASGVLFTIPALFIWGMSPAWRQITLLTMAGGLIGVLFMIPLRRYLIKGEHGKLPYPEGMACAEVLVAAEGGGKQAAGVFWGLGVGMLFKLITDGFKVVQGTFQVSLGYKASVAASVSPPLIGVGYILGIRIATVMVAGGALSALIIIPAINFWGAGLTEPVFPETELLIRDMSSGEIWHRYVRYIGAGAVATGGVVTLIRSIPTMIESFRLGVSRITARAGAVSAVAPVGAGDPDLCPGHFGISRFGWRSGDGVAADCHLCVLLRDREFAHRGSRRCDVEPDFRHDDRDAPGHEPHLLPHGVDRSGGEGHRAHGRYLGMYRCVDRG